jgi:hypothetical protein
VDQAGRALWSPPPWTCHAIIPCFCEEKSGAHMPFPSPSLSHGACHDSMTRLDNLKQYKLLDRRAWPILARPSKLMLSLYSQAIIICMYSILALQPPLSILLVYYYYQTYINITLHILIYKCSTPHAGTGALPIFFIFRKSWFLLRYIVLLSSIFSDALARRTKRLILSF